MSAISGASAFSQSLISGSTDGSSTDDTTTTSSDSSVDGTDGSTDDTTAPDQSDPLTGALDGNTDWSVDGIMAAILKSSQAKTACSTSDPTNQASATTEAMAGSALTQA